MKAACAASRLKANTACSSRTCWTGQPSIRTIGARCGKLLEDKWDKDDPCPDGALRPFNIDAKLNGAYIAMGLLFGNLDFLKTMEIATRCGQDSDCNPSSAAGVLGVILGYNGIPDNCKSGISSLADRKFDFTSYSFNDIVHSTESRALKLIAQNRGKVDDQQVSVCVEQPRAPKLEQWTPGIPDRRADAGESCWTYSGAWETKDNSRTSRSAGSEATLRFNGVAVAILGPLSQDGAQAQVCLDGKKAGIADAYIVERTHDNVLWNVYGLKPGEHTVRLVTTGKADPRSTGKRLGISGAVIYRGT